MRSAAVQFTPVHLERDGALRMLPTRSRKVADRPADDPVLVAQPMELSRCGPFGRGRRPDPDRRTTV